MTRYWSFGYELIRSYVRFAFWLTHKRIVVTGRHFIPKNKPIIFAANHQNALMDPLALACTNRSQSTWLARADLFKSAKARSILSYLKMIPVYRIRDGKENLSNNEHVFAQVTRLLENQQSVALFPEAAHSGKRQMLPHKKAIPRIALEAESKNNFNLDLHIVPAGIYYSHYWSFNRTVIVQYGEPIRLDRYRQDFATNPQKAMLSLRDELHARLLPLCMQISSEIHYQAYEDLRQVAGKAYSATRPISPDKELQLFLAEKELIARLEELENKQAETFEFIRKQTEDYFKAIGEADFGDEQIEKADQIRWSPFPVQLAGILSSLPVFIFGFAFNALPFYLPRRILRKKVKDRSFLSTFNFVSGLLVFPLFYVLSFLLLYALGCPAGIAVLSLILMPFAGKAAFRLGGWYRMVYQELQVNTARKSYRNRLKALSNQRKTLVQQILGAIRYK